MFDYRYTYFLLFDISQICPISLELNISQPHFVQVILFSSFHISGILSATRNGILAIRLFPLTKSFIQGIVEIALL